jgi:hypothetical protein
MALTVAGISMAVGLIAVAKLTLPPVDVWFEGREILVSGAVVTAVLTAFAVGMLAARRNAARVDATAGQRTSLLAPESLEPN